MKTVTGFITFCALVTTDRICFFLLLYTLQRFVCYFVKLMTTTI